MGERVLCSLYPTHNLAPTIVQEFHRSCRIEKNSLNNAFLKDLKSSKVPSINLTLDYLFFTNE